jgi:hypothetical protein
LQLLASSDLLLDRLDIRSIAHGNGFAPFGLAPKSVIDHRLFQPPVQLFAKGACISAAEQPQQFLLIAQSVTFAPAHQFAIPRQRGIHAPDCLQESASVAIPVFSKSEQELPVVAAMGQMINQSR